jgi:hypothetical protein
MQVRLAVKVQACAQWACISVCTVCSAMEFEPLISSPAVPVACSTGLRLGLHFHAHPCTHMAQLKRVATRVHLHLRECRNSANRILTPSALACAEYANAPFTLLLLAF